MKEEKKKEEMGYDLLLDTQVDLPQSVKGNQGETEIAYQNKDITSKVLAEYFVGKTFAVYGIDVPEIVRAGPTNLPVIEVNELRIDNLFELADGSVAVVDYESEYSEENKVKYMGYIARLMKRVYNKNKTFPTIRIIVIYTADVKRSHTKPVLNLEGVRIELTEAFLSDFDPGKLFEELEEAVASDCITDEVMMKFIIYPLSVAGKEEKQKAVSKAIDLAIQIEDRKKQIFILSGMNAFCDRIISDMDAERIKEAISVTKLDWLYYKEKMEAVKEADEKARREEREKADAEKNRAALEFLRSGDAVDKVARCLMLPKEKVIELKESLI